MRTYEELDKSFTFHPPKDDRTVKAHESINEDVKDLAKYIFSTLPECPERTLALRKLQEVRMWANCAIAVHGLD